ncbi:hypothetical protein C7A17_13030 [Ectopseudomonas mendocina]|uniref:Lipoprotein n=1 Tax=Ectopseudomonas mendocina TaxID=300 RepID=A0A2R3QX20_ECTME|nr:hypothetical protein C7A17_13030 [Pseudomonas mendocina]
MSTTCTARRSIARLNLCLLACSLVALSACGTKPAAPICPRPPIPAELLRKAPKPEPLSSSIQASASARSSPTISATPSSAATLPRSWMP